MTVPGLLGRAWAWLLIATVALCCLCQGATAGGAGDCRTSLAGALRAADAELNMRPLYYDMSSLRAVVLGLGRRHCYIPLQAFSGKAEFRVVPRRWSGGETGGDVLLRLVDRRDGHWLPGRDLRPGGNGTFHVVLSGGKTVLELHLRGGAAPGAHEVLVLDRRVVSNADARQLTTGEPLLVPAGSRMEPEQALNSGPLVQFTLPRSARVSLTFKPVGGTSLCYSSGEDGYQTTDLNLANDALEPLRIYRSSDGSSGRRFDDADGVGVLVDADRRTAVLSGSLYPGTYFLAVGPLLACPDAPPAVSVNLETHSPGFDAQVEALQDWIQRTPLGSRIEAVAVTHDITEGDLQESMGGTPPAGARPRTKLLLRANFYCDERINAFEPVAEHAGRLLATLTDNAPSDILVSVNGGPKTIRMMFDPVTGAAWSDPFKGGCAGAGEAELSTPAIHSFLAAADLTSAPHSFPELVHRFVEARFPAPVRADYGFEPQSAESVSVRLNCLKGVIDQGRTDLLNRPIAFWQRLDIRFNLVGLARPRVRVEASGAYTEGGGTGSAHCPVDGQYSAVLDAAFDKQLNAFALQLAQSFGRQADREQGVR